MEQTTKAKINGTKSQPINESINLSADGRLGEAATIAEICAAITKLVHAVSDVGGKATEQQAGFSGEIAERADMLWENVCDFAAQLAHARSSSLDDISGKISIWQHLAPEQAMDNKFPTIDETLLLSILSDVERLRSRQAH